MHNFSPGQPVSVSSEVNEKPSLLLAAKKRKIKTIKKCSLDISEDFEDRTAVAQSPATAQSLNFHLPLSVRPQLKAVEQQLHGNHPHREKSVWLLRGVAYMFHYTDTD